MGNPKVTQFTCASGKFSEEDAENGYEIGFHLRPEFLGKVYAKEAAHAVIKYSFMDKLFAGHNPDNIISQKLLNSLGFVYIGDVFYGPTGLYHPSYELKNA